MKKSLFLLTILFVSLQTISQSSSEIKQEKIKKILQDATDKYEGMKSIAIDFTIKLRSSGVNQDITGKAYKQGNKYAYTTKQHEVVCDGEYVYWVDKENEKSSKTKMPEKESRNISNPLNLFKIWKRDFYLRFGSKASSEDHLNVIVLTPKSVSKYDFEKLIVYIEKETNLVKKIKVYDRSGVSMEYNLTNITEDATIPEGTFTIND